MNTILSYSLTALAGTVVLFAVGSVTAQTEAKKSPPKKTASPFAPIADNPALPRVLLIGDSISIGYTLPVRELLKGQANVHRPRFNCGPTTRGLENLDAWLGKGRWDVIHFNFGLHDLRVKDGKPQVTLEDYEKNLRQIVKRLKKTGATLIWCSTTPVPGKTDKPLRSDKDVLAYNSVAKKIMDENQIAIDDLYAFALPKLKEIQLPANVHFSVKGSKVLAAHVTEEISKALKQRRGAKER
jgi:lysophospholipase L1-like esterase